MEQFSLQNARLFFQKYSREVIIAVGLLGAGAAAVYFYSNYRAQQEQSAQFDFAECFQEFRKAQIEQSGWQEVEFACNAGYRQHGNSTLAPFFLAMQAHSRAEQNKAQEAIATMQESLSAMTSASPFYNAYKIKLALIKLATGDQKLVQEGQSELQALSDDSKNPQQDEALYYLGFHLISSGDVQKGHDVWSQLVQKFGSSPDTKSPWAELAKKKLPANLQKK